MDVHRDDCGVRTVSSGVAPVVDGREVGVGTLDLRAM